MRFYIENPIVTKTFISEKGVIFLFFFFCSSSPSELPKQIIIIPILYISNHNNLAEGNNEVILMNKLAYTKFFTYLIFCTGNKERKTNISDTVAVLLCSPLSATSYMQ